MLLFCFFISSNEAWLGFKKKNFLCCSVFIFSSFSLSLSLSRWIQLLLPMYDELCIFGMDKSTSSPRSGPSYTYPDSLTDHNAICYSSWDHISFSSFFLIYPVYHIYIYIYIYEEEKLCMMELSGRRWHRQMWHVQIEQPRGIQSIIMWSQRNLKWKILVTHD